MLSKHPPEFRSKPSNLHSQQTAGGTQFSSAGSAFLRNLIFGSVHMAPVSVEYIGSCVFNSPPHGSQKMEMWKPAGHWGSTFSQVFFLRTDELTRIWTVLYLRFRESMYSQHKDQMTISGLHFSRKDELTTRTHSWMCSFKWIRN